MSMKLVIIGGVAGGATAAARARRVSEDARIILFERGEFISFANCGLPYYVGGAIKERAKLLVTTAAAFQGRYRIDIRTFSEVTTIDRANKIVTVINHATGETYNEDYDKLIISTGAAPILPPLPGIDNDKVFTLRTIPDADRIKAYIDQARPSSAVVVGGGFIGLEMVENLIERGIKTTALEKLPQVLPPPLMRTWRPSCSQPSRTRAWSLSWDKGFQPSANRTTACGSRPIQGVRSSATC